MMCESVGYLSVLFFLVLGVIFKWLILPCLAQFNAWKNPKNRGKLFIEGAVIVEISALLICAVVLLDNLFRAYCIQEVDFSFDYVVYLLWILAVVLFMSTMRFFLIRRGILPNHINEYGTRLKLILFIEGLALFLVGVFMMRFLAAPFPG